MSVGETLHRPRAHPVVATKRLWPGRLRLRGLSSALAPGLVLAFFAVISLAAPLLAPYDPNALDMANALADPSAAHLLGTDQLGRDLLSRMLYGGRATLGLAAVSTISITLIGLLVGAVTGYVGGHVDLIASTLLTVLLALPSLLLTLAILGILGPGTLSLLIALVGAGWVSHARVFRAATLALREQAFVEAAVGLGYRSRRIIVRHLVPNLLPTVIIFATLDFGVLLLTISSLSFLGLGVQPPTPDWGVMLNDARPYFGQVPLLILAPGACITVVALSSNMLGDALRDLIDRR